MAIASETLEHLDHKVRVHWSGVVQRPTYLQTLDYVSRRTTLFPDFVPPSQTQMIKNMYKQGVIKLQCFGIRCVAFNQTFAEKLRETCTSHMQRDLPGNFVINPTLVTTSRNIRKRERGPRLMVHPTTYKKKKYGPSPAT